MIRLYIFLLLLSFGLTMQAQTYTNVDSAMLQEAIDMYEKMGSVERDWPELDEDSLGRMAEEILQIHLMVRQINPEKLSAEDWINLDMFSLVVEDQLFHSAFKSHQLPLDSEGGFIAGVFYSISNQRVRTEEDLDKYLDKLRGLDRYFDQRIEAMKAGQKAGRSETKLIVRKAIDHAGRIHHANPEETFFMRPLENYIDEGDKAAKDALLAVLADYVFPAYKRLYNFLQDEYLPQAPSEIGASAMADGPTYYEQRVRFYTTYDISPEEVFETGMAEVKRIRAEMQAIIDELGFEGSYADFLQFLRTDAQFYAETPEEIMGMAMEITNRTMGVLPQYFGKLPRNPLTVVPVPEAIAEGYTAGRYSGGSLENNKAGEYWVNTSKLDSRTLYTLPALTLHEGVPGHHTQIMLAAELEDMPEFRRNTYLSSFGEGWALYAEYLGLEAGLYRTPYEQFGRLTYEMWRACRLVVDPGMHYMGWSREEAVEFMASNTALSLVEVNSEIDRYIGWPGQAVSYKMGELKIKELRAKAEKALGEDFDIRAFHDAVLANGSIPMPTLERIIDEYIAAVQRLKVEKDNGEIGRKH